MFHFILESFNRNINFFLTIVRRNYILIRCSYIVIVIDISSGTLFKCHGHHFLTHSFIPFVGRLELDFNLDVTSSVDMFQTPAPHSTKPTRARRRVTQQEESSDEETSTTSVVPDIIPGTVSRRSERASKTAALTKITANRALRMDEDEIAEEDSEVTSDENSAESDQFTE